MLLKRKLINENLKILTDSLVDEFGVSSDNDIIDSQNTFKLKFKTRVNFRGEIKLNHSVVITVTYLDGKFGEIEFDISLLALNLIALIIFVMIAGLLFYIHSNPLVIFIGFVGALWFYFVAKRQIKIQLNWIVDEFIKIDMNESNS